MEATLATEQVADRFERTSEHVDSSQPRRATELNQNLPKRNNQPQNKNVLDAASAPQLTFYIQSDVPRSEEQYTQVKQKHTNASTENTTHNE